MARFFKKSLSSIFNCEKMFLCQQPTKTEILIDMKNSIIRLAAFALTGMFATAHAAIFTVTTTASDGPGSFSKAIRDADASPDLAPVIAFNIAGAGPHYIAPPVGGFPLIYKDNVTIDGYSQPGSAVNTAAITTTNNAVIKIVLDARTAPNFRDMSYTFYGTLTTSDPVINNSSMAGTDPYTVKDFERPGFTPDMSAGLVVSPYTPGEVAILGIYRSTNVTVKGLAFLSDGAGADYAVAVALDYGLDTAVKDRFAYPEGSSRGFHIAGCWIGVDPATGNEHLSGAAIAAFRHRDKEVGGTRPELPNQENMTIGVKAGSANPRAEFNVIRAAGATIASEGIRFRVSGNQLSGAATDIGRYDDTQVPSIVFGTDGDGVNDADEGNLLIQPLSFYNTGNKLYVIAGNTFNRAVDGSRPGSGFGYAVDQFRFDQRTRVQFGSDFNGLNDGLEGNTLYDTLGIAANANAPTNTSWISMRGNTLINNTTLPLDTTVGLNTYNKFIDTAAANPITPVITSATTTTLIGSCGLPLAEVANVVIDVYVSDPEGDLASFPQGRRYLGSFTDNSAADSNPAVGAFTFNTAGLGIHSGDKVTIAVNYLKSDGKGQTSPFATSTTATVGAGTYTVTTTASDGPGSFSKAIRDADASPDLAPVIAFNIAGAGPHYIAPPVGGFPLIYKDNVTIDGYSQPGSAVNTAAITTTNNAVIKIVLDARTAPNFRDMSYTFYGTLTTSDPVINNSSMAGTDPYTVKDFERPGFTPDMSAGLVVSPYTPGEVAILGIYRSTNVTVKGLAFLSDGAGADYAVAVALDYGLDTAVKDRFAYPEGSSRGFHIAGCWIGVDPATGNEHLSGAAIAAFRHRDKEVGGTRPELPNQENMTIGVKAGSANPRAEFNVIRAAGATIASEGIRFRVSGNQLSGAATDIGRYDDTQVPSIVFGTDGDGVNDADEGNLLIQPLSFYNTGNKLYVIAGNTFNRAVDGSRPGSGFGYAVDQFRFDQRTRVQFGSDFNGLNDGLEGNTLYDTLGIAANANAPTNTSWISMRGNTLINNTTLPLDTTVGLNTYNKFIDTAAANPITPVITSATTTTLIGSCGLPLAEVANVVIDVYVSDPEGDLASFPQGRRYLGSFTDNSAADSNPAVGAFTFNTAGLGIHSGDKVTIAVNYLKSSVAPSIASVSRSGGNTTLNINGGSGPYSIYRASSVTGPYTSFATAAASPAVFADAGATAFYKVQSLVGGGQTSPFAISATVP